MTLGLLAMLFFTRLEPAGSYAGAVLPGLLVIGAGMGCIFAPAFGTATLGVQGTEAGVASAMVNTSQQVGGSVGTALLSTIFASAGRLRIQPPARARRASRRESTATPRLLVGGGNLRPGPAGRAAGATQARRGRPPRPPPGTCRGGVRHGLELSLDLKLAPSTDARLPGVSAGSIAAKVSAPACRFSSVSKYWRTTAVPSVSSKISCSFLIGAPGGGPVSSILATRRLHPLRRHIGEPHHADEHDCLLASID